MKNTNISLEHKITNHANELVAIATDVLVMFDFEKNETHLIPKEIKEKML